MGPPVGDRADPVSRARRSLRSALAVVALVVVGSVLASCGGGDEAARVALEQAEAEAAELATALATAEEEAEAAREVAASVAALAAEEAAEREAATLAAEAAAAERSAELEAAAEAAAAAAEAAAISTWTVTNVVDGDTIDVRGPDGAEERVRIAGIDTPERGECGFGPASSAMAALVLGEAVELVAGSRDDRDRYDRIIRYVDVDGVDAGLTLIEEGLAVARYDSRDGYGRHPREDLYVAADRAVDHACASEPAAPAPTAPASDPVTTSGPGTGPGGAWKNCTEAREHGAAPVLRGDPGYGSHLDRDADGIGCE